ncbi:MAG: hypothetical protein JWR37_288, partial [Mycobacterium sp.]|nr:hypothetical protein [Mycobacterium sp.]
LLLANPSYDVVGVLVHDPEQDGGDVPAPQGRLGAPER